MYDKGGAQQKIFHLQKVDGEQSGSQNWRKTSKILEKNIYTLIISIKEQRWRVKLNFDFLSFLVLSTPASPHQFQVDFYSLV